MHFTKAGVALRSAKPHSRGEQSVCRRRGLEIQGFLARFAHLERVELTNDCPKRLTSLGQVPNSRQNSGR